MYPSNLSNKVEKRKDMKLFVCPTDLLQATLLMVKQVNIGKCCGGPHFLFQIDCCR